MLQLKTNKNKRNTIKSGLKDKIKQRFKYETRIIKKIIKAF